MKGYVAAVVAALILITPCTMGAQERTIEELKR